VDNLERLIMDVKASLEREIRDVNHGLLSLQSEMR